MNVKVKVKLEQRIFSESPFGGVAELFTASSTAFHMSMEHSTPFLHSQPPSNSVASHNQRRSFVDDLYDDYKESTVSRPTMDPLELARVFVKTAVRMFYETEHVVVVDALVFHGACV